MSKQYPIYANSDDRKCARALITAIIASGDKVTVLHCEGLELSRSQHILECLKAMAATGMDTIRVRDGKTDVVKGAFSLIYDNGSEGEPMILISDYSANDYCESIYNKVSAKFN